MFVSASLGRKAAAAGFALALAATLGAAATPPPAYADEGTQTMYRLYNPNSGEHFYTASADERADVVAAGWNDEGVGWTAPTTSNTPVYRLYNPNPDPATGSGEHHYTTSADERDNLLSEGWLDEGTGWYSDDDEGVAVYRQYNPNQFSNNHNYTTSTDERDYLVGIGWNDEGIGWYGVDIYPEPADISTLGEDKPADDADSNQLPVTGYYKASLTTDGYTDREVRYYVPDTAQIRPYFHFIAVPDDVDVDAFIVESGWKQVADETGECLYILIPDQSTGKWGSQDVELGYMNAAKSYHSGNGKFFTTFGEFYLTGYGAGAAPLQAWAAENPHWIIAQTYIGGSSYGADTLAASGEGFYGYSHMTDGDNKDRDGDGVNERKDADGNWKILYQMTARLKSVLNSDAGENAGLLKKSDMPVPTWFVNCDDSGELAYWKQANRATSASADQTLSSLGGVAVSGAVYNQKADTWPTEYAGQISKVVDIDTAADTTSYDFTRAIRDEMTDYTRYDNTISYGNALTYRIDYTDILQDRYTSDSGKGEGTVSGKTLDGTEVKAEMSVQRMTLDNGVVSDLVLYVPETAQGEDIPVVMVFHGGSQTSTLFFDSTMWWQTAAEEGFALAFSTRTAHSGTKSDIDTYVFDKTCEILEADGRFDMGRIYVTGQSMGSVATITLAQERTDEIAAAISSNAGNPDTTMTSGSIPIGLVVGEGNYADRGIPGYVADTNYPEDATTTLVRSTEAAAAGADIYWDAAVNSKGEAMHNMNTWIDYFTEANGLTNDNLRDTIIYSCATSLNGGTNEVGTLAEWDSNAARLRTWIWDDDNGTPVMTYIMSMYQAHNCQPFYRAAMWDFLEHYSVSDDGTRLYSESAFESNDAVEILN